MAAKKKMAGRKAASEKVASKKVASKKMASKKMASKGVASKGMSSKGMSSKGMATLVVGGRAEAVASRGMATFALVRGEYRAEFAGQVEMLCRLGARDGELAEFFGVGVELLEEWLRVHGEFAEAVRCGRM